MKLIKTKNGFVNADMIESFAIVEHESSCDIVAYAPSYSESGDCNNYVLGKCKDESEAWARLKSLASQLATYTNGRFDVMNIWESDDE